MMPARRLLVMLFFIGTLLPVWQSRAEEQAVSSRTDRLPESERQFLKDQAISTPRNFLQAAPFEGVLANGSHAQLEQYQGHVVLLNFWATWCVPCLKELPDMERLYQALNKKGLVILAVGMGESREAIQKFLEKHTLSFPLMADPEMNITELYGVQNIPVTYLIDTQGYIFARAVGPREWANPELITYFQKKLLESPQ